MRKNSDRTYSLVKTHAFGMAFVGALVGAMGFEYTETHKEADSELDRLVKYMNYRKSKSKSSIIKK